MEYMLIVVVALVIVALVWFFASQTKTESTSMGSSIFLEMSENMEEQTISVIPLLPFIPLTGMHLRKKQMLRI